LQRRAKFSEGTGKGQVWLLNNDESEKAKTMKGNYKSDENHEF
jgi:hypothetical protein